MPHGLWFLCIEISIVSLHHLDFIFFADIVKLVDALQCQFDIMISTSTPEGHTVAYDRLFLLVIRRL